MATYQEVRDGTGNGSRRIKLNLTGSAGAAITVYKTASNEVLMATYQEVVDKLIEAVCKTIQPIYSAVENRTRVAEIIKRTLMSPPFIIPTETIEKAIKEAKDYDLANPDEATIGINVGDLRTILRPVGPGWSDSFRNLKLLLKGYDSLRNQPTDIPIKDSPKLNPLGVVLHIQALEERAKVVEDKMNTYVTREQSDEC